MTERIQQSPNPNPSSRGGNQEMENENQRNGNKPSNSNSNLQREPTWVRSIDFHDGFDLNLNRASISSGNTPVNNQNGFMNDPIDSFRQNTSNPIPQGSTAGLQMASGSASAAVNSNPNGGE